MTGYQQRRNGKEIAAPPSSPAAAVKIIECPRDAWQGLPKIIPTEVKVDYLQRLLRAGFRHIDAVSFVSPKYVPQMADSEEVMRRLNAAELEGTEIIGIVVNERGFERALATPGLTTIGYPYSLSERFSRQNANTSQAESRALVERMQTRIGDSQVKIPNLVIYISMAFGNPYGDPWQSELVTETVEWLHGIGVRTVSLADTVGKARADDVAEVFRSVTSRAAAMEIGVHLHSRRETATEKITAAFESGGRRFDSALTGLGGCPFAGDELVGNIPTESVVAALEALRVPIGVKPSALGELIAATEEIRKEYA